MNKDYTDFQNEPVLNCVLELMNAIKKKNPLLAFTVGTNKTYINTYDDKSNLTSQKEIKTSLKVHDVNDPKMEVGQIGFAFGEEKFWVRSRLIDNAKYGAWNRSQNQSKYSKHMNNIVKEAKKFLVPLSYEEVKSTTDGAIERVIDSIRLQTRRNAASGADIKFDILAKEVLHMHNLGYTPKTPEFHKVMDYIVNNQEHIEKHFNYNPDRCMIWVRPNSVMYEIDKVEHTVNSVQELPENLRGKVMVLDVSDENQFIEEIGIKEKNGVYWVLI